MLFARTETQQMLGGLVGRLLDAESGFEERHKRLAGDAPDRLALWPALAEQGVLGAAVPEEAGGFGGAMRDIAVVMAEVGRRLVVEPVLAAAVCSRILAAAGLPEEVGAIVAGTRVYAFAHAEGDDPFAPLATQAVDTDGYRLTGRKIAVRHGDLSDAMIVTAALDGRSAAFLVEAGAAGVERETFRLIDGSSAATCTFAGTPARMLGDVALVDGAIATALVGLAAEAVGIVRAVNTATFGYLGTRRQFGVPLASFQALQHRAADMFMHAAEAEALCERAIAAQDDGGPDAQRLSSAAKAGADRAGRIAGHEGVQLHGGMGVSDELDVSHYMRRLAAIRAELGQGDVHRVRIGETPPAGAAPDGFRAEVRAFVRAHLPPDIARKGSLGLEMTKDDYVRWQKVLHRHGYFAGSWPKEFGGQSWDLEKQLVFVQEAALNDAPMIIPYGVNMVGPVLYTFGSAEQQARYLPGILSSDTWWCQGYSEPNAGSDLSSLKTVAVRARDSGGDHYVVNGTKMWTTEAHWADMMHCLVRTDREVKAQRGISFLVIDMNTPGITVRPIVTIDGQHHTNQVFLDDVRVPVDNLVGEEGQGWTIAKFLLANERVSIADTGPKMRLLGILRDMLAEASPSPVTPLHRSRLGAIDIDLTALTELEESYVRVWSAGGSKEGPEASLLKVRGTEILQALTELALEIEGPLGGVHDPADLHRSGDASFSADQRASLIAHQYLYGRCWSIFGGTNEVQRNIIARSLLGQGR